MTHASPMTPTRALINTAATVLLSAVFAALAIAVGMSMQTTTAHAMTTTDTVTTTTTDDYAGGAHYTDAADEDWSADTATDAPCQGVAVWAEMWGSYGADATMLWSELIDMGWTNPANGDTSLLVQPGCA